MKREVEYIDVPSGTRPAECQGLKRGGSCRATVYWIERPSRNKKTPEKIVRIPVDCEYDEQCERPDVDRAGDGLGVSHYVSCPDANRF